MDSRKRYSLSSTTALTALLCVTLSCGRNRQDGKATRPQEQGRHNEARTAKPDAGTARAWDRRAETSASDTHPAHSPATPGRRTGDEARRSAQDPSQARVFRRFLVRFCDRLARGDLRFIKTHVRLPLPARFISNEGGGNPSYRTRVIRTPEAVKKTRLCLHLHGLDPRTKGSPGFPILRNTPQAGGFRVDTMKGQFGVTLYFHPLKTGWKLTRYVEK